MKNLKNKLIASVLALVTVGMVSLSVRREQPVTASAASKEEFLSEVALVYEDSVEDAQAAIAGTDWKLYDKDLNPNADAVFDDGVYLIYMLEMFLEKIRCYMNIGCIILS